MSSELSIDVAHTALLLMDFQNDIVAKGSTFAPPDDEGLARISAAMKAAGAAAEAARASGISVIHVAVGRRSGEPLLNPHMPLAQLIAQADVLVEGSDGFAFHPDAQPLEGEAVLVKQCVSAFAGTALSNMLQGKGINTIVLCGYATNLVVEGTARDGADRGYRVIVLEDGCASGDLNHHKAALENIAIIGAVSRSEQFVDALR